MIDVDSQYESISNEILLGCDTEFIHFSENFEAFIGSDSSDQSDNETFVSLENYQPTVVHKDFTEKINRLKGTNDPDELGSTSDLIQQNHVLNLESSTAR